MKHLYAKMTFRIILISFLAFILIGCGESGGPGGGSGPGETAAISLSVSSAWETRIVTGGEQEELVCEPTATGGERCVWQSTPQYETVASLPADGKSSAVITVKLTDSDGNEVAQGTKVKLYTSLGTFLNGKQNYTISMNESGSVLSTSIIAGILAGKVEITAKSNNISQSTIITFTERSNPPALITLGTSANIIKTDNSDSAIITAVVLDKDHAPVEGASVTFSTIGGDGSSGAGQISASSALTDVNGQVQVIFSSGVGDKRNQVVTIEASVEGLQPKQIPIQVTGSYLTLSAEGETTIDIGGSSTLNIEVRDAGNAPVYDVPVTLSLAPDSTGAVIFNPKTGNTDLNGKFSVEVTGSGIGDANIIVESIGAIATQTYKIDNPNKLFRILEPVGDLISMTTNTNQLFVVRAPGYQEIVFVTTIGTWEGNGENVIKKQVVNGEATAIFNSSDAGTATVQVYPSEDPDLSDSLKIAISAPSSEASKIIFQTSSTVVMPSTSDLKNSVTLIAKVTNSKNQVVKDAPVAFSIITPSGGGEYVAPAIAFTDSSGMATSVFTSGSLVAGADGITVRAELIDTNVSDTVSIIISGKAASLSIGFGTEVESINNDTAYKLPMSVLVTDANGSPVKQASVSLNLWPSHYRTGFWEVRKTVTITGAIITYCVPIVEGERVNEDVNKNLVIDEGEDTNQDGILTPPSSASGAIPSTVVTDENGLANFDMIYMKSSAVWIRDALTASTVVSGSETLSTFSFTLPWLIEDSDNCSLPGSPYSFEAEESEVASVSIFAGTTEIIADGTSTSVIRATVVDNDNTPMSDQEVVFSATLGSFIGDATVLTNDSGVAKIILQAGTSVGTSVVTANADGFTAQVEVTMTASEPDSISITAIPDPVVPDGTVIIIATLFDEFGNIVVGESLNFAIVQNHTGGSLDKTSSPTDVNGQAFITYTAGTIAGIDQIKVTLNSNQSINILYDIDVEWAPFAVGSITLTSGDDSIPADGVSSTTITAVITDSAGDPVPNGTNVRFATNLGTIPGTNNFITNVAEHPTTGDSGTVVVSLISGVNAGTATVIVTCLGVSQSITVDFTAVEIPVSDSLYLSTTKTSILTNNSDFTAITANVLDANNVPIEGAIVNFYSTGAQISASSVVTDVNGEASIILTSGPDKNNHTITVTAEVDGEAASIPITLYGTLISITPSSSQLSTADSLPVPPGDPDSTKQLVLRVVDGGDNPVYDAPISIENITSAFTDFILRYEGVDIPLSTILRTNYAGSVTIELVAGTTSTPVDTIIDGVEVDGMVLSFSGMGTSVSGNYIIGDPDDIFNIERLEIGVDELEIPYSAPADGTPVEIFLHAGGLGTGETVVFATSFGTWNGGGMSVQEVTTQPNDDIMRSLSSLLAGTATVQIYDQSNPATVDSVQISFYNPAEQACDIIIDASQTNILPSTEASQYSLVLDATVYDSDFAPVQDAVVEFWLENTTGGGEFLAPVISLTNSAGIAQTIFTSGSLGTGSDPGSAVNVFARVWAPGCPPPAVAGYKQDWVGIVISGAVANVSIGTANVFSSNEDDTLYLLPVSILVADTNGNPVPGAIVSLGYKPSQFKTGFWFDDEDFGWIPLGDNPCTLPNYDPDFRQLPYWFVNEDLNNNAILDNNEDETDRYTAGVVDLPNYFSGYTAGDLVPGLNNGVLTPGQSVSGLIPSSVQTGENGVVSLMLTYQKEYGAWVEAEITATCMVFGTEYITKYRNVLPVASDELEAIAKAYGGSPFNVLPCAAAAP